MTGSLRSLVALLLALSLGGPARAEPSEHTLIYYNARMALAEGQSQEALKLWLLRNALESQTGTVSPHDTDFGSVTWAALGDLGLCQDGQPKDEDGVGLWPLALHNQVVRTMGRRRGQSRPRNFETFAVGRQQRSVSVRDVLSLGELQTLRFSRGPCGRARAAAVKSGEPVTVDLKDGQVVARLLRYLLHRAQSTLEQDRVHGMAAIEARLFDLDLQLTALAAREARLEARERALKGRKVGLSPESLAALQAESPTTTLSDGSEAARILRECVDWPTREWMALEAGRRRFLFRQAQVAGADPAALDEVALGIVDALSAEGQGEEVERWLGQRQLTGGSPEAAWKGERGQRLLALDRASGFRERSVIALHRGVAHLEQGELPQALRAMAYALQQAPDSRSAAEVQALSRRWLSYVAAQFVLSPELLVTLQELVPARDYSLILEDLMWGAALRADLASFDRGVAGQRGRGALDRRLALLRPLASGDLRQFAVGVERGLAESPSETLRFLDQLVDRLELEDADVRTAQLPTLARLGRMLEPLGVASGGTGRAGRTASELQGRIQAIAGGLGASEDDPRGRARALAPGAELYAGSLRLAPVDALPWPFAATETGAPSVFMPLQLVPEEWRDPEGALVFGWSIRG